MTIMVWNGFGKYTSIGLFNTINFRLKLWKYMQTGWPGLIPLILN
jgi:hypothetical protein